jgi:Domain of unknown function (DUF6285)
MPSNRPTAAELMDAVGGFLKAEVLPLLSGNTKYHLQVALNAVAILGREIVSAAQFDEAERARLRALLKASGTREELNRLLCLKIRDRQLNYGDHELIAHLMQTAMDKLAIDNPKYATYTRAATR